VCYRLCEGDLLYCPTFVNHAWYEAACASALKYAQ
jgi:uncharacterized RmlC-like cupin family protein